MSNNQSVCEQCMIFCSKYPSDGDILSYDVYEMNKDWRKIFVNVCKRWGFTKKNAKFLYRNSMYGNWEHLLRNHSEMSKNSKDWFNDFRADLFYCSDRWSLDRLFRVHWLFRQYVYSLPDNDAFSNIVK